MKPVSAADSGYAGSAEVNPEAIATASGIDLDIVNDERQSKYVVEDQPGQKEEMVAEEQQARASKPIEKNKQSRSSDKKHGRTPDRSPRPKEASGDVAMEEQAKVKVAEQKKQLKKVLSADDKDERLRKRTSQKNRKQSGSHSNSPFEKVFIAFNVSFFKYVYLVFSSFHLLSK